jgi:hypothetical protein
MRNIALNKLRHLLFPLLMVALTGCGASNPGRVAAPAGNASIVGKLQWGETGKGSAKTVADAVPPSAVKLIRMTVTAAGIPTVVKEFYNAPYPNSLQGDPLPSYATPIVGQLSSGQVDHIYPSGNLSLTVQAFDANLNPIFEGSALNISLQAGEVKVVTDPIIMTTPTVKAEDTNCLNCHASVISSLTGRNLVADYKQSTHYRNVTYRDAQSVRAGCVGCHGPSHNVVSPPADRCFECHGDPALLLGAAHLNAASTTLPGPARYLNGTNNNCYACHEPHNPLKGLGSKERQDWAASGHGDVNGEAWKHYDFTIKDTCNACHTPAGFLKALGNGWSNTAAASNTVSSGKQPLTCDGCHSSNNFKVSVRTMAGGYTAGMGGFGSAALATIQFPNVGESNICIPCHASSENGASLSAGVADFSNSSLKNPHYLSAAAVFYGKGGFQFYTSGVRYNTYGAAGKVGRNANWSHGKLGMDNYSTASSASLPGVTVGSGNKGQCVACHLGPKNTHSFDAVQTANATQGTTGNTRGCYGCHNGTDMPMSQFVNNERVIWNRLFDFFAWNFVYNANGTLRTAPLYFSSNAVPFFFSDSAMTIEATDWTKTVPTGTGAKTMGAAMNLKLLTSEKGSFMHNRSFGRALIADSIVYLQRGSVGDRTIAYPSQNGVIGFTAYSTARPAPDSNGVSISTLKSYLTKSSGSNYLRR